MNKKSQHVTYECRACGKENESQKHIISCKILNNGKDKTIDYEKLFSDIVKDQKEICEKFKENMKYLMEIIKWKIGNETMEISKTWKVKTFPVGPSDLNHFSCVCSLIWSGNKLLLLLLGQVKLVQIQSSQDYCSSPVKTCQINLGQVKLSQDGSNQVMTGIFLELKRFWTQHFFGP